MTDEERTFEQGDEEFVESVGEKGSAIEIDADETMVPRAPVVTIMGHVDHGKTRSVGESRPIQSGARVMGPTSTTPMSEFSFAVYHS